MANKSLFASLGSGLLPRASACNAAGGAALTPRLAAARPGPTGGHRLLQRHSTTPSAEEQFDHAEEPRLTSSTTTSSWPGWRSTARLAGHAEGHAGGLAADAVEA